MKIICADGHVKDVKAFVEKAFAMLDSAGVSGQILDRRTIIDRKHLELAYRQASRRFRSDSKMSRTLATEFMLYLAGTHQIGVAKSRVGVGADTDGLMFVLLEGPEFDLGPLFSEFGLKECGESYAKDVPALLKRLGVPETLADGKDVEKARSAVYEHVAMVNVAK